MQDAEATKAAEGIAPAAGKKKPLDKETIVVIVSGLAVIAIMVFGLVRFITRM